MQIGDLSRQTGVNIETIRYYERIGVLPKPARQPNGRRTYSPADAERLGFIRHARELGFDLPSIRILLALQERPETSCEDASRIAQEQLEAVRSRIARLLSLRGELARMASDGEHRQIRSKSSQQGREHDRPGENNRSDQHKRRCVHPINIPGAVGSFRPWRSDGAPKLGLHHSGRSVLSQGRGCQ